MTTHPTQPDAPSRHTVGRPPEDVAADLREIAEIAAVNGAAYTGKLTAAANTIERQEREIDDLLHLILVEMQAATNQDLATDGDVPQGEESAEGQVWAKIEARALEIHEARTALEEPDHG